MFSNQTNQHLIRLASLIIENRGKTGQPFPFKWGNIPDDIEFDRSDGISLAITGEEYLQYVKCLESLAAEPELEHLSKREIDKELWHLTCEVFVNAEKLKDVNTLRENLAAFHERLRKPIEEFEVIIPVENLRVGNHAHEIYGVKFLEMTSARALEWGISKEQQAHELFYTAAVDKVVAILTERGADPWKAADRAREKVATALHLLRIALLIDHEPRIIGWKIHDEELLFKQSEHIAVRKKNKLDLLLPGWRRSFRSVELTINDTISKQIETSCRMLGDLFSEKSINISIRDRLIRSLEWVSNSVAREEPDDKVVDICTALETLLATKDDPRKGERIALRTTLLNMVQDKPFFDPVHVMNLYLKRSDIVHGSARKVCTESDCQIGRLIALDSFSKSLTYILANKITRHSAFIESLQKDKVLVQKAVDFWERYPQYYPDILKAAEKILSS